MHSFRTQLPDEVEQRLKNNESFDILDVREIDEWVSGHIPVAKHIPLGELPERYNELDRSKEIVIVCHSGGRSALACEFLAQAGFNVVNMLGGMSCWRGEVEFGE